MRKIDHIFAMEVTRREFLVTLGVGIMGLIGFSSIVGLFMKNDNLQTDVPQYGMGNYGP